MQQEEPMDTQQDNRGSSRKPKSAYIQQKETHQKTLRQLRLCKEIQDELSKLCSNNLQSSLGKVNLKVKKLYNMLQNNKNEKVFSSLFPVHIHNHCKVCTVDLDDFTREYLLGRATAILTSREYFDGCKKNKCWTSAPYVRVNKNGVTSTVGLSQSGFLNQFPSEADDFNRIALQLSNSRTLSVFENRIVQKDTCCCTQSQQEQTADLTQGPFTNLWL